MPITAPSAVQTALTELARMAPCALPPVLLGFEASRHVARGGPWTISPLVFDMPISEETIVGTAIGLALAGRNVVVDLMFEGFLTRCLEPLLVGWPSAAGLASAELGRVVLRVLGAPVRFGGPSHSANVLALLDEVLHVDIVHATCPEDVAWALNALPRSNVLVLAEPARPELIRGDVLTLSDSPPLRLWRRQRASLTVCTHARLVDVAELVDSGDVDTDVLSTPAPTLIHSALAGLLAQYRAVELRGVHFVSA